MAESRDSTPARKAMTSAEGSNSKIRAELTFGNSGHGSVLDSAPNRELIVSTGRPATETTADVMATATINPGNFGAARRKRTIRTIVARPIRADAKEKVGRADQSA